MKEIKALKKYRWSIWVLVVILIFLTGIELYAQKVIHEDFQTLEISIASHSSVTPIDEKYFAGTHWGPEGNYDTVLSFNKTKSNDSAHVHYDYTFASDSKMREVGYWEVINGNIILRPTKTVTMAANIEKISFKDRKLVIYYVDSPSTDTFVGYVDIEN